MNEELALPSIFVMERGFVLVGRPRADSRDGWFTIVDDCCVIRRWGTTNGLGQLAREGPLPETVLDPEGNGVSIRKTAIYRVIPCTGKEWQTWHPIK